MHHSKITIVILAVSINEPYTSVWPGNDDDT